MRNSTAPRSKRKPLLVAMVLGTALSALGSGSAPAEMPEATARAVTDISRYCTVCWRNARLSPDCWTDCTQEVFCRLLERLDADAWTQVLKEESDGRRELIRAIDTVMKRSQRGRKWSAAVVETMADRRDLHAQRLANDREAVRQAAAAVLSSRQQRILHLSFEGWSVHDIATELTLPAERVSDEKYKAIHKLREYLQSA